MITKHFTDSDEIVLVYEFYTESQYATSFKFKLPSMGIWFDHPHPWIVIMRETQRVISHNWSDLNCLLQKLIDNYTPETPYPDQDTLRDWLEEITPEGAMDNWFYYPQSMRIGWLENQCKSYIEDIPN